MEAGNKAQFLREVFAHESADELLNDLKALTWEYSREHAILKMRDSRRILVRGGFSGIDLEYALENDPFGRDKGLYVEINGQWAQVSELEIHVHPLPTGPSDQDIMVLAILGQEASLLYELNGEKYGTIFRRKSR